MHMYAHNKARGFTLTEMAIVLAIVGLLTLGLWRLISGANEQLRDQGAASQQSALIGAVKSFMATSEGQSFITSNGGCGGSCAGNNKFALPLPLNSACNSFGAGYSASDVSNLKRICDFLPPGFTSTTTNSYGQTFLIRVALFNYPALPVPTAAPTTYSVMIKTTGGNNISDTSGGRISSLIGGDGGFIYSTDVCNGQASAASNQLAACGSYGAWAANINTIYGFTAGSGVVASQTYFSPNQGTGSQWLARIKIPGDANFVFNKMNNADLYMGGTPNILYMGDTTSATNGGTINLQGGMITGSGQSHIVLNAVPGSIGQAMVEVFFDGTKSSLTQGLVAHSNCLRADPGDKTCADAVFADGDSAVSGLLSANAIYSQTFFYQTSDIRLKTNIKPIHDALNDIMKIQPVTFNFKANGKAGLGFIAQDVEKIYPELVAGGSGMKSINYEGFIAPLIKAVQELKKQNDDLCVQLREQSERQSQLEKELDSVKSK